jgi:hypothetical protein
MHCINWRAQDAPQIANCLQEYLPTGIRSTVTFSGEAYTHVYADIKAIFMEVEADPYHANKLKRLLQAWAHEAMYVSAGTGHYIYWADDALQQAQDWNYSFNPNCSSIQIFSRLKEFLPGRHCQCYHCRQPSLACQFAICSHLQSFSFTVVLQVDHCPFRC